MAFRLSKKEHSTREDLIDRLRTAKEAFDAAQEAGEGIPERLAEFIVVLGEAESFRDEIATRWREDYDEKSETWQEEKGDDVNRLIEDWEEADFTDPPLGEPEELDLEDYAQILEDLDTEAE
jgi:hypothetical protein